MSLTIMFHYLQSEKLISKLEKSSAKMEKIYALLILEIYFNTINFKNLFLI